MAHTLPELGYEYNALEPYIDEQTMRIHHTKHHQAYIDNLNKAIAGRPGLEKTPISELVASLNNLPADVQVAVRNNGGGHLNHSFFWKLLEKNAGEPTGKLAKAIQADLGGLEKFREAFGNAAKTRFGSGWAWLVVNPKSGNKLEIMSTANQDNPISDGKIPILGLDVWEHAYYLKYQNKRPDYIEAFFHIINWKQAEQNYADTLIMK